MPLVVHYKIISSNWIQSHVREASALLVHFCGQWFQSSKIKVLSTWVGEDWYLQNICLEWNTQLNNTFQTNNEIWRGAWHLFSQAQTSQKSKMFIIHDWLLSLEGGTSFVKSTISSVSSTHIHMKSSGASCYDPSVSLSQWILGLSPAAGCCSRDAAWECIWTKII